MTSKKTYKKVHKPHIYKQRIYWWNQTISDSENMNVNKTFDFNVWIISFKIKNFFSNKDLITYLAQFLLISSFFINYNNSLLEPLDKGFDRNDTLKSSKNSFINLSYYKKVNFSNKRFN